jgi:hypothetical protein
MDEEDVAFQYFFRDAAGRKYFPNDGGPIFLYNLFSAGL